MGRNNELRSGLPSHLPQNGIDLPLAQNLQMGIRLVNHEDSPHMSVQIGQQQQNLLHATATQRNLQRRGRLPTLTGAIVQREDAASLIQPGFIKPHQEQDVHQVAQLLPLLRGL